MVCSSTRFSNRMSVNAASRDGGFRNTGNAATPGNRDVFDGTPFAAYRITRLEHYYRAVRVTHPEFRIIQFIPAQRFPCPEFIDAILTLRCNRIVFGDPLHMVLLSHGDSVDVDGDMPATELIAKDGRDIPGGNPLQIFHVAPVQALHRFFQFLKHLHLLIAGKERAIQVHGLATITRAQEQRRGKVGGGARSNAHGRIDPGKKNQPVGAGIGGLVRGRLQILQLGQPKPGANQALDNR